MVPSARFLLDNKVCYAKRFEKPQFGWEIRIPETDTPRERSVKSSA